MKVTGTVILPCTALILLTTYAIWQRRRSLKPTPVPIAAYESTTGNGSTNCSVIAVLDGDTIKVLLADSIPTTIRLYGIDSPELGQKFGYEAKSFLEDLLRNRAVSLNFRGNDKYGRKLCEVLINGDQVGEALVNAGYAWAANDAKLELKAAEDKARALRLGVWSEDGAVAPWIWRAGK